METKRGIRKEILEKRISMSEKEWEEKNQKIFHSVISHSFFQSAREIYCYIDYNHEVDTRRIIKTAWELEKKVAVPKIIDNQMEFFYLNHFEQLKKGYASILEPTTSEKAESHDALIIMPGVVFDCSKNRIGYGKGFYDRYLSAHEHCRTIALAFEFQVLNHIPTDFHDICPEVLITEEKIYV